MTMKVFAFITILCLTVSCSSAKRELRNIESFINDRPDSALLVLQSFEGSDLKPRETKALYALLLSQALDKNYIDVATDSLINIALAFYDNSRDRMHLMLTYYYAGRVAFNAGDYQRAAIYGIQASDLAEQLGNHFYAGLIFRLMADTYSEVWNYAKTLDYCRKATSSFISAGKPDYAMFSEMSVAKVLMSIRRFDECLSKLDSIKNEYGLENPYICSDYHALRTIVAAQEGKDDTVLSEFRCWERMGIPDNNLLVYNNIALSFQRLEKKDSVDKYMSLARQNINSVEDSLQCASYIPVLDYIQKHYKDAYEKLSESNKNENGLLVHHLSGVVDSSISNYWKQENSAKDLKVRHSKMKTWSAIIISLLIVYLLMQYALKKNRAAKAYHSKLLSAAEDIERLSMEVKTKEIAYRQFVHKRQLLINDILHAFNASGKGRDTKRVYMAIEDLLQAMQYNREGFINLEVELNNVYSGLLDKLKNTFPALREEEYALLVYWFYGFSQETVSLLTNLSVANLYNLKTAWKSKFIKLGTPDGDMFASLLNVSRARRSQ